MSYQRPPMARTVKVSDGNLRIEPQLQQEQSGFNNESLYSGSLNLFSGYLFILDVNTHDHLIYRNEGILKFVLKN